MRTPLLGPVAGGPLTSPDSNRRREVLRWRWAWARLQDSGAGAGAGAARDAVWVRTLARVTATGRPSGRSGLWRTPSRRWLQADRLRLEPAFGVGSASLSRGSARAFVSDSVVTGSHPGPSSLPSTSPTCDTSPPSSCSRPCPRGAHRPLPATAGTGITLAAGRALAPATLSVPVDPGSASPPLPQPLRVDTTVVSSTLLDVRRPRRTPAGSVRPSKRRKCVGRLTAPGASGPLIPRSDGGTAPSPVPGTRADATRVMVSGSRIERR